MSAHFSGNLLITVEHYTKIYLSKYIYVGGTKVIKILHLEIFFALYSMFVNSVLPSYFCTANSLHEQT